MLRTTRRSVTQAAGVLVLAVVSVGSAWPQEAPVPAVPVGSPEVQTVTLKGTVLGPDGQPVPEAEVGAIAPVVGIQTLDGLFSGKCNQAGEFELAESGLTELYGPTVTYCVLARSADGTLMGAGTARAADLGAPLRIALQAPGRIHSSILGPDGGPVAGVGTWVEVSAGHTRALIAGPQTNELGQVLIGPLPAGLQVGVGVGYESRHLVPQNTWDRKEITLQPGETYELPPLAVDPGGRAVEGTLEDAEGKPLAGAQVACTEPQWPVNVATTDEQGRFRLTHLPVEGYDVWLIAAETTKQLYVMSQVDPNSGEQVRLVLRPLTEAGGLLAGPDGQALSDVPVRIFPMLKCRWQGMTVDATWHTDWVPLPQPVKTAEDGWWQVSGLIAGAMYALQPEVPGARLDLEEGIFEVDREGKPTDLGPMVVR